MIEGRNLLLKLKTGPPTEGTSYIYNNLKITNVTLDRGIALYQAGINKYLGNLLIARL